MKKYKNWAGYCQANTGHCPRKADMTEMDRLIEDLNDTIVGLITMNDPSDNTITWAKVKKELGYEKKKKSQRKPK